MKLLYRFINYFGFISGIRLFFQFRFDHLSKVQLPGYMSPFRLRPGTTDIAMFYQVYFNKCYDLNLDKPPKVIIDAGANIGLASIFFANKFPQAKIICVEPQTDNHQLALENLKPYNATILHAALWSQQQKIQVIDQGLGESGYVTRSSANSDVNAITLLDIIAQHKINQIDILKIDIEGSEVEVFSQGYNEWLPLTRCIIIETHDNFRPGSSKAVFAALHGFNFDLTLRGENLVFLNRDLA